MTAKEIINHHKAQAWDTFNSHMIDISMWIETLFPFNRGRWKIKNFKKVNMLRRITYLKAQKENDKIKDELKQ